MIAPVALVVFASALALDFAAARWQLAFNDGRARLAARWSVVICLLSTVSLLALVDVSRWMILPECLGVYAGTLLGARHSAS